MNTLDDLRATFDRHADDLDPGATAARVNSVRARAVRARRQRTGAVAGAAAAVVAVVVATTLLPGGREPALADRQLLGRTAPAELSALGYTYAFERGVDSRDGASSIELDASDEPRLITWATSDSSVKLVEPGDDVEVSDRVEFDDWTYVPPGSEGTWTVHANDTALAVYELTDERPEGLTVGGDLTFRQQVGDEQLVTAAALSEGETELTLTATVPENERMRLAQFCQGVPLNQKLWVNVSVDGDGATSSGGCDDESFDPATGDAAWLDARHLPPAGEEVEVRTWISRGLRGEPIAVEGARMALALYDVADPAAVVGGWDMARLTEHDGHLWTLLEVREADPAATRLDYANDTGRPVLAVGAYERVRGVVTMRSTSDDSVTRDRAGGGAMGAIDVLPVGESARVSSREPLGPRGAMGLAIYERVD